MAQPDFELGFRILPKPVTGRFGGIIQQFARAQAISITTQTADIPKQQNQLVLDGQRQVCFMPRYIALLSHDLGLPENDTDTTDNDQHGQAAQRGSHLAPAYPEPGNAEQRQPTRLDRAIGLQPPPDPATTH